MSHRVRETAETVCGVESQYHMSQDSQTKRTSQSSCKLLLWEERERGGGERERGGEGEGERSGFVFPNLGLTGSLSTTAYLHSQRVYN